jgi:ribonuclease HI
MIVGYCDGACKNNPGKGGWGCFYFDERQPNVRWCFYGAKNPTTNNEMELTAFLNLLKEIKTELTPSIKIFSDSKYVLCGVIDKGEGVLSTRNDINGWLKGWSKNGWTTSTKQPVKNKDLWKEILNEITMILDKKISIQLNWVKGHSSDENNDYADYLSNVGI